MQVVSGTEVTQSHSCTHLTTLLRVPDMPPHTHRLRVPVPDRNRVPILETMSKPLRQSLIAVGTTQFQSVP
jgi:hypothetical protein